MLFDTDSGGGAVGYSIANSFRNISANNNWASFTPGTPTANTVWTWSGWVKRSGLGAEQMILTTFPSAGYAWVCEFATDDTINCYQTYAAATNFILKTNAVYRDTAAWYHIQFVCNIPSGTVADRFQIWVNGTRVTSFASASYPSVSLMNGSGYMMALGDYGNGGGYNLNGYFAEVNFIDGQALDSSYFGQINTLTGQWIPKKYTGTYGNNGSYLDFSNGASTTTLGYDKSGGSKNWTLQNCLRDGSVNDCWSYDTPTNNFCTLNPIDTLAGAPTKGALTLATSSSIRSITSTFGMPSSKWYWEVSYETQTSNALMVGLCSSLFSAAQYAGYVGQEANSWAYTGSGQKYTNASGSAYGSTFTAGDVIGVAYDADSGKVWFSKNGTWQASGDPAAGTNAAFTGLPTGCRPAIGNNTAGGGQTFNLNAGQVPVTGGAYSVSAGGYFRYAPPTGFKALSTKNLSAGSVTTSGSFTGNVSANGPFVWLNGTPTTMTIDSNAVTWGVHADKLANGFKIRTASSPYNDAATNNYSVTVDAGVFKYNNAEAN